jgi:hypothetical protein
MLEGVDLPLWGLEVDVEEGRREFAEFSAKNNTADQVCMALHIEGSEFGLRVSGCGGGVEGMRIVFQQHRRLGVC